MRFCSGSGGSSLGSIDFLSDPSLQYSFKEQDTKCNCSGVPLDGYCLESGPLTKLSFRAKRIPNNIAQENIKPAETRLSSQKVSQWLVSFISATAHSQVEVAKVCTAVENEGGGHLVVVVQA